MIEHVPVILCEVDGDGVITSCEGDGLRLLDKRAEDLLGRTVAEVYPDQPLLAENHRRALAGGTFSSALHHDGRTWHATYVPRRDADGQVTGFTSICLDVTEAAQAEAQLRERDDRLKLVTRSIPMVLFAVDRHGVFTLAEGRGFACAGLDPSQVIGHTLEEWLPNLAPTLTPHHRRVLAGEEFGVVLETNGRIWDMRYVPLRGPDGGVTGFCGVGLDITERRRSEIDLKRIQRRDTAVAELSRAALAGAAVLDLMRAASNLIARELPGIDYAGVGEITPDGLRRATAVGVAEDAMHVMLSPEPNTYAAMRSIGAGQSVIVEDWDHDDRFAKPNWLRLEHVKSSAFFPILTESGRHVFGFIGAHSKMPRAFAQDEIAFLETVANVLGDLVARQQAQDDAAQVAERFRTLAENSPDLIVRFDRDMRMVYANGTVERLTGVSFDQLIGRTLREAAMAEPQVSAVELALGQVLRSGMQRSLDVDVPTVRGPRTFQTRMAPEIGADNQVQSVVVSARDISDRQRARDERAVVYEQLLAQQTELRDLLSRLVVAHKQELAKDVTAVRLSDRERKIIDLIAKGWTNREISRELAVSHGTVKNDVTRILQKLDVSDRAQAAAQAVRLGLTNLES